MRPGMTVTVPLLVGLALACSDSTGVVETDLPGTWTASAFVLSVSGTPAVRDVLSEGYQVYLTLYPGASFSAEVRPPPPPGVTVQTQWLPRQITRGRWELRAPGHLVLTDNWSGETIDLEVAMRETGLVVRSSDVGFDLGFGTVPTSFRAELWKVVLE
jgi:hypothetical protein